MENYSEITVIIPVGPLVGRLHQLKETLVRCSGLPIQIIIVCDDHNDGTQKELKLMIQENHKNIDLIAGKFGGPGPARNAGLEAATSPWIAFWDADDLPNPSELLRTLSEGMQEEINLICFQYTINDARTLNEIYHSRNRNSVRDNLIAVGTQPGIWRFVFAKNLISNLKFVNSNMGEDQEFLSKVLIRNPQIMFTSRSVYRYLIYRKGQLTSNNSNISHLVTIVPLIKKSFSQSPAKYQEAIQLMLSQVILTMLKKGDLKVKIFATKFLLSNLLLFVKSIPNILSEKKLRNG